MLVYVKNSSTAVTLGLTKEPGTLTVPHPDIEPLEWFCTQVQKDIDEHLQPKPGKKATLCLQNKKSWCKRSWRG